MTSARTPLLASSRRSQDSERSDRQAEAEDDALHGESTQHQHRFLPDGPWAIRLREIIIFIWALLATAAVIILAVWTQHRQQTSPYVKPSGKRNLVFMVSDGMGPASLSLTRSFRQLVDDLPYSDTLTLDQHFWGTSRTRSTNSLVTDSAAGATAFSCGKKSYNGAISMLPDYTPCGTVLEAAKRAGYKTGLVVTTDITDATPACFASHVRIRAENDAIALQEIGDGVLGRMVDLMLGGGRCRFLPNTTEGSCRADDIDVAKIAQEKHGWTYHDDRAGFDSMALGKNVSLPVLGLFADHDVPFELDRRNMADVYPSLSEMATTALRALEDATKDSDQGFFLMIEGSRIDHAGHINDPAAQVREVLEYDKTFKTVVDFLDKSKSQGVLVATSDHETGGLVTARQNPNELPVYNWYPAVLANANASAEHLSRQLLEHIDQTNSDPDSTEDLIDWINTHLVINGLGITDALEDELKIVASYPEASVTTLSKMISVRARVGWSTHGHSAVDVNVYSSGGPGTDKIRGSIENTEIGKFLREYLSVDVDAITKELNKKTDSISQYASRAEQNGYETEGLPMEWVM